MADQIDASYAAFAERDEQVLQFGPGRQNRILVVFISKRAAATGPREGQKLTLYLQIVLQLGSAENSLGKPIVISVDKYRYLTL